MKINETREKIVSVAKKLFGRFGFQKTSMDEIAKIAKKAKGSLYYHFPSKEDLFREVLQKEMLQIKSKILAIINNSDFTAEGKLKKYILTRLEEMQFAANYQETIQSGEIDHFEFVNDIKNNFNEWEKNKLVEIINEGVKKKEFHIEIGTEILSEMFIMIIKGLEVPFFIQGKYRQYLPQIDGMTNILLKGMR